MALSDDAVVFDLEAYLTRIGYAGARVPTLETLQAIHALHAEAIPFENLNPLLRLPVFLDSASLQQKLVQEGRGGYCFEHNGLFVRALTALGFRSRQLAARVVYGRPEGYVGGRHHMLLCVDLDEGPYIADVGFGGLTLTAPLRFETGIEQSTPHEPFRLVPTDDEYVLQAKVREVWVPLYRFGREQHLLPDYEVSSWYLCNHPESLFVNVLIAARTMPDRRYGLRNNELSIHHLGGETERRVLTSADDLRAVLEGPLGITLPDVPGLDLLLARLTAPEPPG